MKRDVNEVIRQLARERGISAQRMLEEMQQAIDAGYESTNPAVRAEWAAMPFPGKPTPQELIVYLSKKLGR